MSENDIIPEQRAAYQRLRDYLSRDGYVALLDALDLPSDLTDPQPVLPTEPGTTIYGGRDQPRTMFRLDYGSSPRHWIDQYGERRTDAEARDLMGDWEETPPTVALESITREQFGVVIDGYASDFRTENDLIDELVALTNGADR